MIFHSKYYMDKSEAQESVLTVDDGATVIASKCWIFEDWVDVKDANGTFAYSQQEAIEGAFEELIVPESVTTIEERAFCGHAKLRRISVLSGVTEIGKEAFKGCDQLPEVVAPRFRVSGAKDPETKKKLAAGFCAHRELYAAEVAEDYLKYLKSNRKKLWQESVFLHTMLENQLIPLKELDGFLEIASPEIRAVLLEHKYAVPAAERKKEEDKKSQAAERELMREKPTAAELKKLWSVKKVDAGTIELTGYHGTEIVVEIPDVIGKQTVVRLNGTFHGNGVLQKVIIPKTVTEIVKGAFEGCSALTEIALSEKLKIVGASAFSGCSALRSLTLPKSVTKIGTAFAENCGALQALQLSEKIREIPMNMVSGCYALEEVRLPEKCKTIANFAFLALPNLQRLYIPASVENIGFDAIVDCPKLTIHAPSGSFAEQYAKEHNIPFEAE